MLRKILKNTIFRHAALVLITCLVAYFLVAPLLINRFLPDYATLDRYESVQVCTDLSPTTQSKFFLPISCESVNASRTIGCVYTNPNYSAPTKPSTVETRICPLLVSRNDSRGIKNSALTTLPIDENTAHIVVSASLFIATIIVYCTVRVVLVRRNRTINFDTK